MERQLSFKHEYKVQSTQHIRHGLYVLNFSHLVILAIHFIILTNFRVIFTSLIIPNQPPLRYIRQGDLNIGGIISGLDYSADSLCGSKPFVNSSFHFSEAIAYAIDEVNSNEELLPNVTLGFVILDDCMKETTATIQAISFVKHLNGSVRSESSDNQTCAISTTDAGVCEEDLDILPSYDVVGVVGCLRSSSSAAASMVLGPAQVPLVSFTSTSETLNNKELYPYFMRVVPSDNSLVDAQIAIIRHFGWSYISVVYDEGSFGENAFQALRTKLSSGGETVCIATSHQIFQKSSSEDFRRIMSDLATHRNARVVISYTDPPSVLQLLKASHAQGTAGTFIWMTNESWKSALGDTSDENLIRAAAGCIVFGFQSLVSPSYNKHVLQMDPSNSRNPWLSRFWELTFKCSVKDPACISGNKVASLPGATTFTYANNAYEAVLTYAYGLQTLINSNCPNATGKDVRDCITGPDLLKTMRKLSFHGPTGEIEFDQVGSVLAKIQVEQIVPSEDFRSFNITPVAIFYSGKGKMRYLRNVSFDYIQQYGFVDDIPESVCSKPCGSGQFNIPKLLVCCWECKSCRTNEILVNDFSDCFMCPYKEWPDPQTNFTICEPIPPDYPQGNDPVVILCQVLAVLGVVAVAMVAVTFARYRNMSVIKASGRELSCLQLLAVLLGYLTMPVLTVKPSNQVCSASFFLYCLSFTWVYAPLLVKAVRIHRIFSNGKMSKAKVKFVSPKSQICFSFLLISVQMFLCTITAIMYTPEAKLTQPIRTEKYVELSCDWTLPGLSCFLVYNIILVFLCSIFAFKTRKLPDNFNESKFITLCVYTTLVIWAAFIPSYFTATGQTAKTLLLALSLLLNHTVVLTFLYLPKIYAAVNLIPITSVSSCTIDDNTPRRGSVVSSIHNTRFLTGLSEVLSALRLSQVAGKVSVTGVEVENVAIEHAQPTHNAVLPQVAKLNLSKVSPIEGSGKVDDHLSTV